MNTQQQRIIAGLVQESLTEVVKNFLIEKGITQKDFAIAYGCQQGYMNLMINSKKPFQREKLESAIQKYGCSLYVNIAIEEPF